MAAAPRKPGRTRNLNLLPVMNLVTILIPMLLIAMQLAELAVIDTTVPGLVPHKGDIQPAEKLSLSVVIEPGHIAIRGAEAALGDAEFTIPCADRGCTADSEDALDRLGDALVAVKDAHPAHTEITLLPAERVPYDLLIAVMDTARERTSPTGIPRELFPHPLIGHRAAG